MSIYTPFITAEQLTSPVNSYSCRRITKQNIKQFGFGSIEELHKHYPNFPLVCQEYVNAMVQYRKSDDYYEYIARNQTNRQQKKAKYKREYENAPRLCRICNSIIAYEKRNSMFCSRSCSNFRVHTNETKTKISKSVKLKPSGIVAMCKIDQMQIHNRRRMQRVEKNCKACGIRFETKITEDKMYCSRKCNPSHGGYRKGSGRAYGGYYNGIYCHSTYELVWVMYNTEKQIPFAKCNEVFDYIDDKGIKRRYFPDFIQGDVIIEIKGFHTRNVDIKKAAVVKSGRKISILYRNDLETMFQWFSETYPIKTLRDMFDNVCGPASRI